jgi:hypothetical protein
MPLSRLRYWLIVNLYALLKPKYVNQKLSVQDNQQANSDVCQEVNTSINRVTNMGVSCKPCLPC